MKKREEGRRKEGREEEKEGGRKEKRYFPRFPTFPPFFPQGGNFSFPGGNFFFLGGNFLGDQDPREKTFFPSMGLLDNFTLNLFTRKLAIAFSTWPVNYTMHSMIYCIQSNKMKKGI